MADKTYDEWCKIVNDKFDEIEDPQWSDIRKVAKQYFKNHTKSRTTH